jgi:hypothetical protein
MIHRGTELTAEQMALQMFQVQIRFVTMRALIFTFRVLGRVGGRLSCCRRGPAGVCRKNTAPSLLSDNVQRLRLLVREHRRVRI